MGASGWNYFTPYRPDINVALQELRQRVFDTGEYEKPPTGPTDEQIRRQFASLPPEEVEQKIKDIRVLTPMMQAVKRMGRLKPKDFQKPDIKELTEAMQGYQDPKVLGPTERVMARERLENALNRFLASGPKPKKPRSIEALLKECDENGTHSILDIMNGVSNEPAMGVACPMPDSIKMALYGTLQPTHEQVEAKAMQRYGELDRWQAWYVIVYQNGQPSEVYFEGCSGD